MFSVVPVAIATEPLKVVQEARADASPAFWMVVVAALQLALLWAVKIRLADFNYIDFLSLANGKTP